MPLPVPEPPSPMIGGNSIMKVWVCCWGRGTLKLNFLGEFIFTFSQEVSLSILRMLIRELLIVHPFCHWTGLSNRLIEATDFPGIHNLFAFQLPDF